MLIDPRKTSVHSLMISIHLFLRNVGVIYKSKWWYFGEKKEKKKFLPNMLTVYTHYIPLQLKEKQILTPSGGMTYQTSNFENIQLIFFVVVLALWGGKVSYYSKFLFIYLVMLCHIIYPLIWVQVAGAATSSAKAKLLSPATTNSSSGGIPRHS